MKDHAVILASFLTACLAAYSQISEVEVQFGDTVSLPCNSSAYGRGELDVQWEAMGKNIAFFQNGQLKYGRGYEGHVELQISKALEGDFSLNLRNAVMSDTDLYECLWQGKRSISTVMLNVLPPPFPEPHTFVSKGEDVTLPCYGKIPKNKPLEKMFIQWLKDDKEILLLSSGEITSSNWRLALPSTKEVSQGTLSLTINSVMASDQGIYRCLYKATDYEAPRSGVPETYTLRVLVSQGHTPSIKEASNITEMTSSSISTELTELSTSASEDNTTMQDTVRVSSETLLQSNTTTDFTGLIADDSATVHDTAGVIFNILLQSSTTTDFTGLIADDSADSTTVQDTAGVISEMLPQSSSTTDFTGLIADDSTTVQDIVGVISEMLPQSNTTTDFTGLIADDSADSTTEQDTAGVIFDILPQSNTTTDFTGLIADDSADSTTEQDTAGVIFDILPQSNTTTDFTGLITDDRADSTTVQDTAGVISETLQQAHTTTDFTDVIADDSNAVQATVGVILEILPQPSRNTDLIGFPADDRDGSTALQDPLEGEEESFEFFLEKKVPWVRIGIISGVLLVTAAFLGTLVALGNL